MGKRGADSGVCGQRPRRPSGMRLQIPEWGQEDWARPRIGRSAPLVSILFVALVAARLAYAGAASDLAHAIAQAGLDSQQCYRVRGLTVAKEDLRLYFTNGYLIFGKPAGDAPISAV